MSTHLVLWATVTDTGAMLLGFLVMGGAAVAAGSTKKGRARR